MAKLSTLVNYCDERVRRREVADFPGSANGLQFENNGEVKKVGAAVDAGIVPFQQAIEAGVDFLIVHHGMFWNPVESVSGRIYQKFKLAIDHNLAVYSSHLPLDAHPEIGNNRLLADVLNLEPEDWFLEHEGTPIALLAKAPDSRDRLKERLNREFNGRITAMEYGSEAPKRVAVLTGSGRSAIPYLKRNGTDTLITGELKQDNFNLAQEEGLNLYACGHYATETYGVEALAREVAAKFGLEYAFIRTECPL